MNDYLLDTSICVFLFRDKFNIAEKLNEIGYDKCYISSITIAELAYGAYKSNRPEHNIKVVRDFCNEVNIVPFEEGIEIFAQEKNKLRIEGELIEDFDLFIAAAALARQMTLVTDNVKHFERINGLQIENWIKR